MRVDSNILNFCTKTESVYGILDIFKNDFLKSFGNIKAKERPPVIKAMPYLYRMWYYTALIDDSVLSPANFINHQISKKFGEGTIAVPVSSPVYKNRVLKDFNFDYLLFNLDSHPVLNDIRLFLECCTPDMGVDESGLLLEEERDKIINLVSFKEIFYITFLTNTCYSLKLLRKMRGINAYRAMPQQKNIDEFFNLTNTEKLQKIVEVTINNASKALNPLIPYDRNTFSAEALKKLFNNSLDLDEYMEGIYKKYNINTDNLGSLDLSNISDIKDVEDLNNLNLSEETITSIFMKLELSFIIDAYLLTPLGYYLQLIKPLYYEGSGFDIQFRELIQSTSIPDFPLTKLFFTICSCYDVTSLGREVLLGGSAPKDEYQLLTNFTNSISVYKDILRYRSQPNIFPLELSEEFFNSLDELNSMFDQEDNNGKNSPVSLNSGSKAIKNDQVITDKSKAYSFKVKPFTNKRSYKTMELKGTQSLEELAHSIILGFDLDYGCSYSFFMNNKAYDCEHEITCPFPSSNKPITPKHKVYSLSLCYKQKFLFIYDFDKDIRFEVEFLGTTDIEKNIKYPRIAKQSNN